MRYSIFKLGVFHSFLTALLISSFFPLSSPDSARAELLDENNLVVDYAFDAPSVTTERIEKDSYNIINIKGLRNYGETGAPSLPVKGVKVAIPEGKEISSSSVTLDKPKTLTIKHKLLPVQQEYPLSDSSQKEFTKPDSAKYVTSTVREKLISKQLYKGYQIAVFNLFPVRYLPKQNEIQFHSKMRLHIKLKDADKAAANIQRRPIKADRTAIQNTVDNPNDVPQLPKNKPSSATLLGQEGPFEYVIITNTELANASGEYSFQDLAANRHSATLVTTDDPENGIFANYSGVRPDGSMDYQTKIRNFIIDAYNNWGTQYVLLGGDGDTENSIIPARFLTVYLELTPGLFLARPIPSDSYYSCLDGTFDANANGTYGEKTELWIDGQWVETDEVDFLCELAIGRAPVNSADEVSNFVRKTLAYEQSKTNLDSYLYNTVQVGEYLGFGGVSDWAKASLEEIRLGSSNHGYTTVGFSPAFTNEALYQYDFNQWYPQSWEYQWNYTLEVFLSSGLLHLVNHLGHANYDTLMYMDRSEASNLGNGKPFVGYSQGCIAGAFDVDDSIVEHLVFSQNGAAAFIANARYGWGYRESTAGSSNFFARQFWDALFGENIFEIGKANQDSKDENLPLLDYSKNRWVWLGLNLFGDPALRLFADEQALCTDEEYFQQRFNNESHDGTPGLDDSNDYACCPDDDCVYNGVCYEGGELDWSASTHAINHGTNKKLTCSNYGSTEYSFWYNLDYSAFGCLDGGYVWHTGSGDANIEPEYSPGGGITENSQYCAFNWASDPRSDKTRSTECCCGDDVGEYYMLSPTDGTAACCDSENEYVLDGVCQNYSIPEICQDGLDNDKDGLTDECNECGCPNGLECNFYSGECVACNSDHECNDNQCETIDTCVNPGESDSFCSYDERPNTCGEQECGSDGCYPCGSCRSGQVCSSGICLATSDIDCRKFPTNPLCINNHHGD